MVHSLELVDCLLVKADKSRYNYYITRFRVVAYVKMTYKGCTVSDTIGIIAKL